MGRDPCHLNVDLVTIWKDEVGSCTFTRWILFVLTEATETVVSGTSSVAVWVRVTSTFTFSTEFSL